MGFNDRLLDQETVSAVGRFVMFRPVLSVVLLSIVLSAAGCCSALEKAPPVTQPPQDLVQQLPMDPSSAEPPVVFEMPELMCVAEAEGIAFVPDLPIDVFYYEEVWFWQIRDTWYWSRSYMGMLYELSEEQVPGKMLAFGKNYRQDLPDCREFTYDDWHRRMKAAQ